MTKGGTRIQLQGALGKISRLWEGVGGRRKTLLAKSLITQR